MLKLDRRRDYFLILDTETATLPFINEFSNEARKTICIAKPLVYDIGWVIADKKGNIYLKRNYLVSETFCNFQVFNTAYYRAKRPIYIEMLEKKKISVLPWDSIIDILIQDLQLVKAVGAYNSMFDFKKAIPFTESYIENLYSQNFECWLKAQKKICEKIITTGKQESNKNFDGENFVLREKKYPLFDIWGLACTYILNNNKYRKFCIDNMRLSPSQKYYSTTAETAFQFLNNNVEFSEAHTALDDSIIETKIFSCCNKKSKNKIDLGITYFPFRIIGKVE